MNSNNIEFIMLISDLNGLAIISMQILTVDKLENNDTRIKGFASVFKDTKMLKNIQVKINHPKYIGVLNLQMLSP